MNNKIKGRNMYTAHILDIPTETQLKKPQSRLFKRLISCQPSFALYFKGSDKRKDVEQYIYDKYQHVYHAELNQYMPCLVSMESHKEVNSVMGLRVASNNPLFIEQYSKQAIEDVITEQCQILTSRDSIVEIGNLAAVRQGSSQLLMIIVVALLYHAGYKWAVFAATKDVRHIMDRLNFSTYKLCKAKPDMLNGSAEQWGNYYDTKPYLMAGDLRDSYKKLQNHRLYGLAIKYFNKNILEISDEFNLH